MLIVLRFIFTYSTVTGRKCEINIIVIVIVDKYIHFRLHMPYIHIIHHTTETYFAHVLIKDVL